MRVELERRSCTSASKLWIFSKAARSRSPSPCMQTMQHMSKRRPYLSLSGLLCSQAFSNDLPPEGRALVGVIHFFF